MVRVQGNSEIAYTRIRQAIVEGRYYAGQRLIEQRIAEELDLSRTPIREALRILEAEGIIVSEPNKGSRVRSITAADLVDFYALRARLESLAAELAAERADAVDIRALNAAVTKFEEASTIGKLTSITSTRAINEANASFHGAVLAAARHNRLNRLLENAVDIPLVFRAFQRFDTARLKRSAVFHGLIRDAIASREPERAGRLMTEHILQGRDVLLMNIEEIAAETVYSAGS